MDFDSQRHNFQSLQCNPKKRDELKVSRGKELLEEAKRTYEQLNSELHDELPALYDSRVLFLVTNLQTLFAAEQVFHTESAKVYIKLVLLYTRCSSFFSGMLLECENLATRDAVRVFFFFLSSSSRSTLNAECNDQRRAAFALGCIESCKSGRLIFFLLFCTLVCLLILLYIVLVLQVFSELEAIVDKLANDSQRGSYTLKKNSSPQSPKSPNANSSLVL